MNHFTNEQRQAFDDARRVVDPRRAREILQQKNWQHGMCGCLNAAPPQIPAITEEETAAVARLWRTLPGWTSWMSALYLLVNQPQTDSVREEATR